MMTQHKQHSLLHEWLNMQRCIVKSYTLYQHLSLSPNTSITIDKLPKTQDTLQLSAEIPVQLPHGAVSLPTYSG